MGRPRRRREDGESGMSTVEVVLLAPLVIGFIMVLVCFGVLVNVHGDVQGAARDAARMGSLQRDYATAIDAARQAASADLRGTCAGGAQVDEVDAVSKLSSRTFTSGSLYTIQVTCSVPLSGLDWFSLGTQTVVGYSTAPLDTYRRAG